MSYIAEQKFFLIFLTLFLISFHGYGLPPFNIGSLKIVYNDLATLPFILFGLIYLRRQSIIELLYAYKEIWAVLALLSAWLLFQAFRAAQVMDGITLFLQHAVNMTLLSSLMIYFIGHKQAVPFSKILFTIFITGAVIATISLIIFYITVYTTNKVMVFGYEVKIGYILSRGRDIRLGGFARDPNFYAFWLTLSLTASTLFIRRSWKFMVIGVIIAFTLWLTQSRTFFIAYAFSLFLICSLPLIKNKSQKLLNTCFSHLLIIVMSFLAVAVVNKTEQHFANKYNYNQIIEGASLYDPSPTKTVSDGFRMTDRWKILNSNNPNARPARWKALLNDFCTPPCFNEKSEWQLNLSPLLIGRGLRSTQLRLGDKYSHNSYIDLLYETGLVGLGLFAAFGLLVLIRALPYLKDPETLVIFQAWVACAVFFMGFGMFYDQYFWFVSALLLGKLYKQRQEVK